MKIHFLIISFLLLAGCVAGATTTAPSPLPSFPSPKPPPHPPQKAARSPPQSPPPIAAAPANCSDDLVSFSKCLPYTAYPPNNTSDSPSRQCCNVVDSAIATGDAVCFCYLIQKPDIFGFPLNTTRILSLISLCRMRHHGTTANFSLTSLCSSPVKPSPVNNLPPPTGNFTQDSQESTADSDIPAPANSYTSVPADSYTPAPPEGSHSVPRLPLIPSWKPFSSNGINSKSGWLLPLTTAVVYVDIHVLT
ncbi:hypothetical protein ACH5RR_033253 [Cinchona calisaya]|uniref:Bifunctional inhibitor/plant lipid transfer protein/seed storage helical domain-containing protein n=1 Tax=Cinchona calisaya TaxID=153742 RepID=A0ABD2YLR8_9GENT